MLGIFLGRRRLADWVSIFSGASEPSNQRYACLWRLPKNLGDCLRFFYKKYL
jgi:hypothetical protein